MTSRALWSENGKAVLSFRFDWVVHYMLLDTKNKVQLERSVLR
jgi:hypothetical protein